MIVVATDSAGAKFGHSSTATFGLSLLDINDNAPTFTSSSVSARERIRKETPGCGWFWGYIV